MAGIENLFQDLQPKDFPIPRQGTSKGLRFAVQDIVEWPISQNLNELWDNFIGIGFCRRLQRIRVVQAVSFYFNAEGWQKWFPIKFSLLLSWYCGRVRILFENCLALHSYIYELTKVRIYYPFEASVVENTSEFYRVLMNRTM